MKIFIIPRNHEYIKQLKHHLERAGTKGILLKPFHYSSFSNLAKLIFYRLKGVRVIHVHWLYIFPFSFVMKGFYYLCKILGIKIIWEMHNILPHGYTKKDVNESRWFFEKVDGLIVHNIGDIARAQDTYGTRVEKLFLVVPHGNFNESYENVVPQQEARKRLGLPQRDRIILCFGFIRKNRGYEYLISAVRDMKATTVIVAGKLHDQDVHKSLQHHQKTMPHLRLFVQWIPDAEIQLYFNASDVVVLPYTDITTSGVIPLAYAFARPVVTTEIGGIRDIVTPTTGVLVPPGDAEALKSGIEKIFNMDYKQMGKDAQNFAMRAFSWDENIIKITEFYEKIASSAAHLK